MPAARLAREVGAPLRSVYRDLHTLEKAGFPITRDSGARWKLDRTWLATTPFSLPIGQYLSLEIARRLMRPLGGSPAMRDFEVLYQRLTGDRGARDAQGDLFERYRRVLATRSELTIDYSGHAAVLERLCLACEQKRTARVVYFTESRGEVTRRAIDPYSLYYDPQLEALYVFARCHLRRAMRTFAVHRFRRVGLTSKRFEVPSEFSPEAHLRGAFRIWREGNTTIVVIRLRPATTWVSERRWHASQVTRHLPDGSAELAFTVDSLREITRFVMQLGPEAEVVQPLSLRREIALLHAEAARIGNRAPRDSLPRGDKVGAKRTGRPAPENDRKELLA